MEQQTENRIENKNGGKIQSFRDLAAWQEGHGLVLMTYSLTKKFPKDELFALVSQMRRAAVSVTSNIAEGFGRSSFKEKAQFYSIAQGSVTELQNQFIIAKDIGYISEEEFSSAEQQAIKVHRITHGLIKGSKRFLAVSVPFLFLLPIQI